MNVHSTLQGGGLRWSAVFAAVMLSVCRHKAKPRLDTVVARLSLLVLPLVMLAGAARAQAFDAPVLHGPVTDYANVLGNHAKSIRMKLTGQEFLFAAGDVGGGVEAGVDGVLQALRVGPPSTQAPPVRAAMEKPAPIPPVIYTGVIVIFIFVACFAGTGGGLVSLGFLICLSAILFALFPWRIAAALLLAAALVVIAMRLGGMREAAMKKTSRASWQGDRKAKGRRRTRQRRAKEAMGRRPAPMPHPAFSLWSLLCWKGNLRAGAGQASGDDSSISIQSSNAWDAGSSSDSSSSSGDTYGGGGGSSGGGGASGSW